VSDYAAILGPPEYIAWDQEPDHFQVYGDNGTICTTDTAEKAQAVADALRAALKENA
jgi:hypothetical protein